MKRATILAALVVMVSGVMGQSNRRPNLTIEGINGENFVLKSIGIFGPTVDTLLNVNVDARHKSFPLNISSPKIVIASTRKKSVRLYLAPGLDLTIRYDSAKKDFFFAQKGAIPNNFIKKTYAIFEQLTTVDGKYVIQSNEYAIKKTIDTLQNSYAVFYKHYIDSLKIQQPLAGNLQRYIDANIILIKENYLLGIARSNPQSPLLLKLTDEVSINKLDLTSVLMQVPDYTTYLTQYFILNVSNIFFKGKDPLWSQSRGTSIAKDVADFIDSEFAESNRSVLEFLQAKNIAFWNSRLGWTNTLDTLRLRFDAKYPSSPLKIYLDKDFKESLVLSKGHIAPSITGIDSSNQNVGLTSFKGKPILIDLWATWCGPCIQAIPSYVDLQKKFGSEIVFLNVSVDANKKRWQDFLIKRTDFTGIHIIDSLSIVYRRYYVTSIPRYILIDKQGNIYNAFAPSPSAKLEEEIRSLLRKGG